MSDPNPTYTIEEVAAELNFSVQYIRLLIRNGRLKSNLVPITDGSLVSHHLVTKEELERYRNEAPHKSRRADGRNKFIVYLLPIEIAAARKALKAAGLEAVALGIRPANKLKGYTQPPAVKGPK